jgi:hypothetical protein
MSSQRSVSTQLSLEEKNENNEAERGRGRLLTDWCIRGLEIIEYTLQGQNDTFVRDMVLRRHSIDNLDNG